jgi:hypothetical protein
MRSRMAILLLVNHLDYYLLRLTAVVWRLAAVVVTSPRPETCRQAGEAQACASDHFTTICCVESTDEPVTESWGR